MEAYKLRIWGKYIRSDFTETCGLLWGYARSIESADGRNHHARIEHASVDLHAERGRSQVTYNDVSNMNKKRIVEVRWPHLSLIGDFHTHPYENYSEAKRDRGWEFSDGDRASSEGPFCGDLWRECRVSLVLTIANLKKVREDKRIDGHALSDNVLHWQMDNYLFWLSAYALDKVDGGNGSYRFMVAPGSDGKPPGKGDRGRVYLDVPTVTGTTRWFEYSDID